MPRLFANSLKYELVLERLRGRLRQGDFALGDQFPSQRALAREYGVNLATINKAVSILASEGCLGPVQGKGMFVTKELPETPQTIGMVHEIHPTFMATNHFYVGFFGALNHLINQDHYAYQPFARSEGRDHEPLRQSRNPALRRVLNEAQLSGLIVFVGNPLLLHDELEDLGIPYVCFAGNPANSYMPNCLAFDLVTVGRQAAKHLIGAGCCRLGVVPEASSMLVKGLSEICSREPQVILQIFPTLEEALIKADGILVTDDYFALSHFNRLIEALPPERLVVFANTEMVFPQPLPRINIDSRRVARCAWQGLQARMRQDPLVDSPVLIPPDPLTTF